MALRFTLKLKHRYKPDQEQSVYAIYTRSGIKVERTLKDIKVKEKDWDSKLNRIKARSFPIGKDEMNSILTEIEGNFQKAERDATLNGRALTESEIRKLMKRGSVGSGALPSKDLLGFSREYVNEAATKPNYRTNMPIKQSTLKNYRTSLKVIQRFYDEVRPYTLDEIDNEFLMEFKEWGFNNNWSHSYIGRNITFIKTVMAGAHSKNLTTNTYWRNPDFRSLRESADEIHLNEEELEIMAQLVLENDQLRVARDLFIFSACTGLRVSDTSNLKKYHIKKDAAGKYRIEITVQKTGQPIKIPLKPIAREILEKYDFDLPMMNSQKQNRCIKEVAALAGLDDTVERCEHRGGKQEIKTYSKYDLVKTHTARRSFCTNAYDSKMDPFDIMPISGHKSLETFLKYIKRDKAVQYNRISNHPFFN